MERLRELLRFDGRLSRLMFWRAYLQLAIVGGVLWCLALFAILAFGRIAGALLILLVPAVVANVGIAVRRLHDRGKSGWWLLLFGLFPLLMSLAMSTSGTPSNLLVAAALGAVVFNVWGFFEIGLRRGTPGDNRYGEVPLA